MKNAIFSNLMLLMLYLVNVITLWSNFFWDYSYRLQNWYKIVFSRIATFVFSFRCLNYMKIAIFLNLILLML